MNVTRQETFVFDILGIRISTKVEVFLLKTL